MVPESVTVQAPDNAVRNRLTNWARERGLGVRVKAHHHIIEIEVRGFCSDTQYRDFRKEAGMPVVDLVQKEASRHVRKEGRTAA